MQANEIDDHGKQQSRPLGTCLHASLGASVHVP